jgi:hypothetical protein
MRDAFGNVANHLGDSRIHMHSPELLSTLAVVSDTALLYELSSQKANGAAQVWVELLTPSGLHATAYSHHSNVPQAQYVASSLDLPCSHCFVPLSGHNYTYRSVCNTSNCCLQLPFHVDDNLFNLDAADGLVLFLQRNRQR